MKNRFGFWGTAIRFAESNDWMASDVAEFSGAVFASAMVAEWSAFVNDGRPPGLATSG